MRGHGTRLYDEACQKDLEDVVTNLYFVTTSLHSLEAAVAKLQNSVEIESPAAQPPNSVRDPSTSVLRQSSKRVGLRSIADETSTLRESGADTISELDNVQDYAFKAKASYEAQATGVDLHASQNASRSLTGKPLVKDLPGMTSSDSEGCVSPTTPMNFPSIQSSGKASVQPLTPMNIPSYSAEKLQSLNGARRLNLRPCWKSEEIKKRYPEHWAVLEHYISGFRVSGHEVHRQVSTRQPSEAGALIDIEAITNDAASSWQAAWRRVDLSSAIHPDGVVQLVWNMMCLAWILYDAIILPLQAFQLKKDTFLSVLEWMSVLFWTFDLLFQFRSGFYSGTRLEMAALPIAVHYVKTWFTFDFICVVVTWVGQFWGSDVSSNALRVRVLRGLQSGRILRFAKFRNVFGLGGNPLTRTKSAVRAVFTSLFSLGVCVLLTLHVCACIWYALGKYDRRGWTTYDDYRGEKDFWFWYMASYRWVVAQLNGRVDMDSRRTMAERNFTVLMGLILGVVVLSLFTSVITNAMIQISRLHSDTWRREWFVNDYLQDREVSRTLEHNIRSYLQEYTLTEEERNAGIVIDILPPRMQEQLFLEIRGPALRRCGYMEMVSDYAAHFRHCCCVLVRSLVCVSGEVVFGMNEHGTRMLAVEAGELHYSKVDGATFISGDPEDSLLVSKGAIVSEAVLWLDWYHPASLIANGACTMFSLRSRELTDYITNRTARTRGEELHASAVLYATTYVNLAQGMDHFDDLVSICVRVEKLASPRPGS